MGCLQQDRMKEYAWILLYWMPYDNDLWQHAGDILDMLASGTQSTDTLVVVVSDLSHEQWLVRRLITGGKIIDSEHLAISDSSSAQVFADTLDWLCARFTSERWAIVILGHGGRLDQISRDEHPTPEPGSAVQWMGVQELARFLEAFRHAIERRIELIFLQNCCKGSLEVVYSLKETSRFILASQRKIGAPNYYYEPLLLSLAQNVEIDGSELATRIQDFEREDSYHSLALISSAALAQLPGRLDPLIDDILASDKKVYLGPRVPNIVYAGELLVDSLAALQTAVAQVGSDPRAIRAFREFCTENLVIRYHASPAATGPTLSGLNLFIPTGRQELDRYRYLDIYGDTKLAVLLGVVRLG